jgi:carboxypeptidase C (cathepsin A)
MVRRTTAFLLPLVIACFSYQTFAQQRGANPSQPPQQQQPGVPAEQSGPPAPSTHEETAGPNEEKISTTSHAIRLDGRDIKYTATTGTLPIRGEDGKPTARMFFVAYTRDGEDVKTRPISFLYNGGPGAATVWLHMGSFAPRHVQMAPEGFQPAPPYHFVDNESSLIDVTDMVFVDAVSTGYSRPVPASARRSSTGSRATSVRSVISSTST